MVIIAKIDKKSSLTRGEGIRKLDLINELEKYNIGLLELALLYARNFEDFGEDITKKWETAEEQREKLQEIYNKGYEDGFYERRKRIEVRVQGHNKDDRFS